MDPIAYRTGVPAGAPPLTPTEFRKAVLTARLRHMDRSERYENVVVTDSDRANLRASLRASVAELLMPTPRERRQRQQQQQQPGGLTASGAPEPLPFDQATLDWAVMTEYHVTHPIRQLVEEEAARWRAERAARQRREEQPPAE